MSRVQRTSKAQGDGRGNAVPSGMYRTSRVTFDPSAHALDQIDLDHYMIPYMTALAAPQASSSYQSQGMNFIEDIEIRQPVVYIYVWSYVETLAAQTCVDDLRV